MALRFLQILIPGEPTMRLDDLLGDREILGRWQDIDGERVVVQLVLPAEETEPLMDRFEDRFGRSPGFRMVLLPLEAAVPKIEEPEPVVPPPDRPRVRIGRVSRDELRTDIEEGVAVDRALVALSAIAGAVGLIRDDVAVLVGAMVIAPLLGPNIALALGTTLGDIGLLRSALRANLVASAVVLSLALGIGWLFTVDPEGGEIASRTEVDFGHIVLAMAAGAAGTLAYTRGLANSVIGVMVAVALMPPLVVFGMLLGDGHVDEAGGALLFTAANVVGLNLAATATFVAQGVRPRRWWEEDVAKTATARAFGIWVVLLAVLVVIVVATR